MASPDKAVIQRARNDAQRYAIKENKDLRHFLRLVEERATSQALKAAARDLGSFLGKDFVVHNKSSVLPRSDSHGVAAYIPYLVSNSNFDLLKLASDTQWDEFLRWQAI